MRKSTSGNRSLILSKMGRYKDLVSDTIVIGLGNFTTKLIYFFLMPIYTVSMSAGEFGEADLLNNLAALLLPVFTLSVAEGVFRFVLDAKENPNELLSSGIRIVSRCAIVALIVAGIAYFVTKEQYWLYFYLYFISEAFRSMFSQFARGSGNVRNFSISGIIAAIVLFCSTYFFVKLWLMGVVGYLLSFVVANVCSILYLTFSVTAIRCFVWMYSPTKTKEILIYSLPLIPNTLSWWATNVSSRYILAYHCGIALAGLFAATSKLPALVNVVTSVFQQSWQISSIKQSESNDRIDFYSEVFALFHNLVICVGSLIIVLVPVISKFVLKGEFYQAWPYTPLLIYSAVLGCYSVYFGNFYTITKNSKAIMKTTLVGAISNIVLCVLFIPFYGIYGALIANVMSFVIIVVERYIETKHFMPIKVNLFHVLSSLVLLLLVAILMTYASKNSMYLSYCMSAFLLLSNGIGILIHLIRR